MAFEARRKFIGAVEDEWELYSNDPRDYSLGPPIGYGASSTVYTALYQPHDDPASHPTPTPVALKVLDLDSLPQHSLSLLRRETQLMSLSKHPNVLRVRGSWIEGHKLYIALRLMNKGSAADVMRYGWQGGMEEEVVRCILRQALEGLNYLHVNGFIHRDIKAANLLIDDDGTVLLGDLGVSASLSDEDPFKSPSTSRQPATSTSASNAIPGTRPKFGKRLSFVGTPCWMAPELIQGKHYDSSADIWSFGITALELSQGRPPNSRLATSSVLLQTVRDKPPALDRTSGTFKYSSEFARVVEACLTKDPSKRPTASELLQMPFFKQAKRKGYLVEKILKELPPLAQRQERRRRQNELAHGTVDSWDFATTVNKPRSARNSVYSAHTPTSPTSSVGRRFGATSSWIGPPPDDGELHPSIRRRSHQSRSTVSSQEANKMHSSSSLVLTDADFVADLDLGLDDRNGDIKGSPIRFHQHQQLPLPPPSPEASSPSESSPMSDEDTTAASSLSDDMGVISLKHPKPPTDILTSKSKDGREQTPSQLIATSATSSAVLTAREATPLAIPARKPPPPSSSISYTMGSSVSSSFSASVSPPNSTFLFSSSPPKQAQTQAAPSSLWRKFTRRESAPSKEREKEVGFLRRTTSRLQGKQ